MGNMKAWGFLVGALATAAAGYVIRDFSHVAIVRARATMEEIRNGREQIVITEIPYQTNKSLIIERIADLVRNKKLEDDPEAR
ncbi:hypothetical protein LCGC14_2014270 [marine sediment metagenome]|uniref:DNA topoisomerase type IIA domain-containing protein n=1 Tax=marine sediment metagenome TaxID=412755 RepID=A0A0F9FLV4_9ZZZZ